VSGHFELVVPPPVPLLLLVLPLVLVLPLALLVVAAPLPLLDEAVGPPPLELALPEDDALLA
jgi:hypothetical protein